MEIDTIFSTLKKEKIICHFCGNEARGGLLTVVPDDKGNFDMHSTCLDCMNKQIKGD